MRRFSFCSFIVFIVIVANNLYAQDAFVIDGNKWLRLDKTSKVFYLAGYLKGAYRGILVGLRDIDCVNLQEIVKIADSKYKNLVGRSNLQKLLYEIDDVYKDKRNISIETDKIIIFAFKKLKGDMSKQKQEAWLGLLRAMHQ